MRLWGISTLLLYLLHAASPTSPTSTSRAQFEGDEEEEDYDPADSLPQPDLEQRLRSASSVDELMSLVYPSFWAALKCRSKLSAAGSSSRLRSQTQERRTKPQTESDEPTYAAAFLNLDLLKSIESEWRKTQCAPREVCVDVAREFGAPTNRFYKPPCVSVFRCGGCCHSEDKQCRNISTGFLSKTLFEITVPMAQGTQPVTISVANHTECSCLSKPDVFRQVHSIIRRALPQCPIANRTCPPGQAWSSRMCRCVGLASSTFYNPPPPSPLHLPPPRPGTPHSELFLDVCGPDKHLDPETCQCVCRHGDQRCGPERRWDRASCRCVCALHHCPAHFTLDPRSCQCRCARSCPRHQPLDHARCTCQCHETPNKCFLRGRRFHQPTCSCVRPPCEVRRRRCDPGFSFSEEVCRCVPSHWRRLD